MLTTLALLSVAPMHPPRAELRGVWLTTTANDAIRSRANTASTMKKLADIGLNTVYVEVWKNGYTQFPSSVLKKTAGVDRHPDLKGTRDLLRESLDEAHRAGLTYVAWFEYGFMAAHEGSHNELLKLHKDWMTTTVDGKLVSKQNPFVWMNPLRPECQEFLLDLIKEAVRRYPLDGIQLDDRIAWPTSMGYDPYTIEAYRRAHGGQNPPSDSKHPAWVKWRAEKVTAFARRLDRELKAIRPNLIVSISPAVFPWSLDNYACDWPTWLRAGYMDEFIPQVYRAKSEDFARDWRAQHSLFKNPGHRLAAGIMIDGPDGTIPWIALKNNLDEVQKTKSGVVFWYSRALLGDLAAPLKSYFAARGPAVNPHIAQDSCLTCHSTLN